MSRSGTSTLFALSLLVSFGVAFADPVPGYLAGAVEFFGSNDAALEEIMSFGPAPEEVPVIFLVGQLTGTSPATIAKFRTRGDSWKPIMDVRGAKARDLYFIINAEIKSEVYAPIFTKFKEAKDISKVDLTDAEIIDLVNLRFIYRRHAYSVFEVMEARDAGLSFPEIYGKIGDMKKEATKKERAEKEAKKKESGGK